MGSAGSFQGWSPQLPQEVVLRTSVRHQHNDAPTPTPAGTQSAQLLPQSDLVAKHR